MKRKALILSSMLFLLGNTLIVTYIVMAAFFTPEKTVMVSINSYGEMYADLAVLVFTICAGLLGLYHAFRSELF
jgi:hypothetical protein